MIGNFQTNRLLTDDINIYIDSPINALMISFFPWQANHKLSRSIADYRNYISATGPLL